jgi:hypothetical protein
VRLASRGLRDMDGGPERIQDPGELATVRAQARRVLFRSLLATGGVMIGLLVLV